MSIKTIESEEKIMAQANLNYTKNEINTALGKALELKSGVFAMSVPTSISGFGTTISAATLGTNPSTSTFGLQLTLEVVSGTATVTCHISKRSADGVTIEIRSTDGSSLLPTSSYKVHWQVTSK